MTEVCSDQVLTARLFSSVIKRLVRGTLLLAVALLFIRPKLNAPILGPFAELCLFVYVGALPLCMTVRYGKKELHLLHSFWPILIYVLVVFLFSDGSDYEGIRKVTRSCIDVVVVLILAYHAKRQFGSDAFRMILITVTIAAAIQAAAMYAMFLSPAVKSQMTSIFGIQEQRSARVMERASGFQSRGGDGLAMNQAIGAIAALILFYGGHGVTRVKYLLLVFFILAGTLLAARSGIVVFAGAAMVYLLRDGMFGSLSGKLKLVALFLLSILLLYLLFPYMIPMALDTSRGYNNPLTRAFEPIRIYCLEGRLGTPSTDSLRKMLTVFPETDVRFIFGNSQYGREGSEYVRSDVGYIRFLHGAGLVGVILSMTPFAVIALHALATRNIHLIALTVLGLIGHIKIIYLYSGFFITALSLFYLLSMQPPNRAAVLQSQALIE